MDTVSKFVPIGLHGLIAPQFTIKNNTIRMLMEMLYEKCPREQLHSRRVSQLCFLLASELGLDSNERVDLGKVGLLHDIGKIAIPANILNKSEPLLPKEWQEIQQHSDNGYRFLSAVSGMGVLAEAVLAHHERWDGSGYPTGLRGRQIPVTARIVSVVDAYDAMVSVRPYRRALTLERAQAELRLGRKSQFDPEIVDAFLEMLDKKSA